MRVSHTVATVVVCEPITDKIVKVVLLPEIYIPYNAGQYLQIILNNAEHTSCCYSIANAPLGLNIYELHIRYNVKTNSTHKQLLTELQTIGRVNLSLPQGVCDWGHLDPREPLLLIAQGTGFAPMKALLEQAWAVGSTAPIALFWSGRFKKDLYMEGLVNNWVHNHANFRYAAYPYDAEQDALMSAVLTQYSRSLAHQQIVMSGSFPRIHQMRDQFIAHGAIINKIHSDAFLVEKTKE